MNTPPMDRAAETAERTLPIAEVLRSEARLRALVESDSVMVWTTDPRGMVEDMPVWRRLTGQTPDEVRGMGWADAIHPADREEVARAWRRATEHREPYRVEYRLRMADGTYRWYQARGVPVLAGDGTVREWAGTFHDVHARQEAEAERAALLAGLETARRRAEEHAAESAEMASRLQEQAAEMQEQMSAAQALAEELEAALQDEARLVGTLHRIGASLTSERELARIVQAATDEATALTGAQFGAFFYNVISDAGESYTLYTISGVPREAFSRFPMPRNTAVFAPTFHGEGVVRSDDITRDPRYGHSAPYHGMPQGHLPVRSYLAVPVVAQGGEVLGGLFFGHARTGVFDERGERLAAGIAGWAAVAIENARLHDAERRARAAAERAAARAERLLEVAQAMAGALSPAEVAEVALEQGMRAVGASAGSMCLLAADGTEFEQVGTRGYPEPVAERFRRFPVHPGRPLSDAVLTGEPLLLPDLDAWQARYPGTVEVIRETGFGGYAAAPILAADGRAVGALGFSFAEARGFDDGVAVFLETLAEQCGAALERARLYQAEHAARAEAEAANRAKGQFLASMSHELRTPLNAIGGYVDLLQMELRGPVTEQQQADLERVKRAQRHLLGLINNVLNFAKLEAGRIELEMEDVALGEVLDDVEALIAPQAAARGIAFDPAAGDAVAVRADREKLEQVLLNLLSNAVKFTPEGGTVSLDWERAGDAVRVHVRDSGVGVPADKHASIFEPFVQVDPDLTRTRQGTGLGLAISRELARAMGGDITVRSAPGEGSTFTVHLQPA